MRKLDSSYIPVQVKKSSKKGSNIFLLRLHDQKASRKTDKYTFRFAKTLKDAFWHLIGTNKCDKRTRRATYLAQNIHSSLFGQELSRKAFEKIFDENIRVILKNSRAAKEKERYSGKLSIENLEKICSAKLDNFLSSQVFENCSKLSSWKKRKTGLMKTMRKVKVKIILFTNEMDQSFNPKKSKKAVHRINHHKGML